MSSRSESYSSSNEDDTSTENSVSTENSSFDIQIKDYKPDVSELSVLLSTTSYVSDIIKFLECTFFCKAIFSDDLVLGLFAMAKYSDIRGCLTKNLKKTINSFLENQIDDETVFLFSPRINNLPLNCVFDLYNSSLSEIFKKQDETKTLSKGSLENGQNENKNAFSFKNCVVISKLQNLSRDELAEVSTLFPEFSKEDLMKFPVNNEQIFFLKSKKKRNTEVDGTPARIYLMDREDFDVFINSFRKEICE